MLPNLIQALMAILAATAADAWNYALDSRGRCVPLGTPRCVRSLYDCVLYCTRMANCAGFARKDHRCLLCNERAAAPAALLGDAEIYRLMPCSTFSFLFSLSVYFYRVPKKDSFLSAYSF